MDNMSQFFETFLTLIADWLGSEPIVYIFGLFCLFAVIKVFRQLLP